MGSPPSPGLFKDIHSPSSGFALTTLTPGLESSKEALRPPKRVGQALMNPNLFYDLGGAVNGKFWDLCGKLVEEGTSSFYYSAVRGRHSFEQSVQSVIHEIVSSIEELSHIRISQLRVSASFARTRRRSGVLAYVVPMKFNGGVPVERRVRGRKTYHFAMLPWFQEGLEILYVIYFMWPRFMDLPFRDKLETIVHELYHIHPQFNGELRRFKGRSSHHGDMKEYDRTVRALVERFLKSGSDLTGYEFLRERSNYPMQVIHLREPKPKLLKVVHGPSPEFGV